MQGPHLHGSMPVTWAPSHVQARVTSMIDTLTDEGIAGDRLFLPEVVLAGLFGLYPGCCGVL